MAGWSGSGMPSEGPCRDKIQYGNISDLQAYNGGAEMSASNNEQRVGAISQPKSISTSVLNSSNNVCLSFTKHVLLRDDVHYGA